MKRNNVLTVVKVGGSVITHKDRPLSVNREAMERIATEISEAGLRLVLVHGGGSFGHPLAHKYKLSEGFHGAEQLVGLSETHAAMLELNRVFVSTLIAEGIPAVSMAPRSIYVTRRRRIWKSFLDPVKLMVDVGGYPVLFGDVVTDVTQEFCVLSGDQIAAHVATSLGAKRLVFALNVDGFFSRDPRSCKGAHLVPLLKLSRLRKIVSGWKESSSSHDVTYGIVGKLRECIPVVERGIEVVLVNGLAADTFRRALEGQDCRGTRITV